MADPNSTDLNEPDAGSGSNSGLVRMVKPLQLWGLRFAQKHPSALLVGWIVTIILWLLTIPAAYLLWIKGIPVIWTWANDAIGKQILAGFASFFLFCVPFWIGMLAYEVSSFLAKVSVADEAARVESARDLVLETERDAIERLEDSDAAGLLPLLRYSRAQLDAYYEMGLQQTRRSFFHAVIAMWLGFLLLLTGVFLYVGPVDKLGLQRPSADINLLIVSSAVIVELISALFLWVYRSTIGQLTFYYRLQMRSHTAILCFRMTQGMGTADDSKAAIITALLDSSLLPERPAADASSGLRGWWRGSGSQPPQPSPTGQ